MVSPIQPRKPAPRCSLAELFPDLAAQWDTRKNGGLTPREVSASSSVKAWWRCSKASDHVWQALVSSRSAGNGCPYCANQKVCRSNSLATLYPALARRWHPARNGALRPSDVVPDSPRKVWWKCGEGSDHEWQAQIRSRAEGGCGCPFCSGLRASATNSLARRRPALARLWHPTKNGPLRPSDVSPGSERVVWWKCPRGADHEWRGRINHVAPHCSFCAGRRVSVTNCLATTHPQLARLWHPTKNGSLTTRDVVVGSSRIVWWRCPKGPDHVWRGYAFNLASRNTFCPFCSGRRASVTNSLAHRFPVLARQWHPTKNGALTPS